MKVKFKYLYHYKSSTDDYYYAFVCEDGSGFFKCYRYLNAWRGESPHEIEEGDEVHSEDLIPPKEMVKWFEENVFDDPLWLIGKKEERLENMKSMKIRRFYEKLGFQFKPRKLYIDSRGEVTFDDEYFAEKCIEV